MDGFILIMGIAIPIILVFIAGYIMGQQSIKRSPSYKQMQSDLRMNMLLQQQMPNVTTESGLGQLLKKYKIIKKYLDER